MGILKSGLLGSFSKKVGPIIGRRHRGINVISPLYRKKKKVSTKDQLDARLKFSLLNNFLSNIEDLVNTGFKKYTKGNSPINAAFKYNYEHAFINDGATYLIDYPKMVYSRGRTAGPESAKLLAGAKSITFSWLPQNQSLHCQFTDLATFLVYNPLKGRTIKAKNAVSRHTLGHTLTIPQARRPNTLHCYMSFTSADGKLMGDSIYIGSISTGILPRA